MLVLGHPHRESVSWCQKVLLVFHFLCIASGPVTVCHWKEPVASSSLHPAFRYYIHWWDLPTRLLLAEKSQLSQPFLIREMLQSLNHVCGPLQDSLWYVPVSLVLRSPDLDTVLQLWPHQCWVQGKDHLPWPADNLHLMQLRISLALFLVTTHFWLMFSLSVYQLDIPAKLPCSWSVLNIY